MKFKPVIEAQRRILDILIVESKVSQYDLPKRINKSYKTTLRYIKNMENEGLITLLRKEPSQKGGNPKKIYGLTRLGIIIAAAKDLVLCPLCHNPVILGSQQWNVIENE